MSITAQQVKELRERTGAGMMECKKALQETAGDIEAAIEHMRKTGVAKAAKKAARTAAEGIIVIKLTADKKQALIIEINCETDFVGRDESFKAFANAVAEAALAKQTANVDAINNLQLDGETVETTRQALIAKLGENIQLRRAALINSDGLIGSYIHGGRIGVVVAINQAKDELGKDLAMHIAASNPQSLKPEDVPESAVSAEKEIFIAQAKESGKPDSIIEKMVQGRIKKFLNESSLTGQPFVKDPGKTVGELLKENNADVTEFVRFEVGEGIEKETQDFAQEVMAQAKGDA